MRDLAVLIPTRGRPGNIGKVIAAWDRTNAWDVADMVLVIDQDDPQYQGYLDLFETTRHPDTGEALFSVVTMTRWMPMVHKLNSVANNVALSGTYSAIGFAGDDHLPQTIGWAQRYLAVLGELKTGMVYGDDGYQGAKLSTEWAITADVVRALGRMVPADVEHMYCDNSILDLFQAAGAVRHLPEVRIEHMHPIVGKAESDEQYQRVNHRDQFRKDRNAYESWASGQKSADVAALRELRAGLPEVEPDRVKRMNPGSGPRRVAVRQSSGSARVGRRLPFPRHFRRVRGATPEEIGITLADFAITVPADQEIVELGVFQGKTALMMAWGARQGHGAHVTAIDPWDLEGNVYDPPFTDDGSRRWAVHNVGAMGYTDRIRLIQNFSHQVAANWVTSADQIGIGNKPVGLLYVDGDHTKEGARRDIVAWSRHLAPGARIAVDDYGHPDWPGVREAVDELVDEGLLEPVQIYHDRLAVTRLATHDAGKAEGDNSGRVTAITSEGVATSPGTSLTVPGQVADEPDEFDRLLDHIEQRPTEPDSASSTGGRERLTLDEAVPLGRSEGDSIEELTLGQLKSLARDRGIVLGARKDLKATVLQALRAGE